MYNYTYDLSGRIIEMYRNDGSYIRTNYDERNLTTGVDYSFAGAKASVSYSYNKNMDNALEQTMFTNGDFVKKSYDSLGRNTRDYIYANNVIALKTDYKYLNNSSDSTKTSGLVSEITYNNDNINNLRYEYDNRGNIKYVITDNILYDKYTYDALNQLTRADCESTDKTYIYTYDKSGNITSKKTYTCNYVDEDLSVKTLLETINYTYGDSNWKDKLTAYNGKTITYDKIGNPLTYNGQSFTWLGRRMMTYSDGKTTTSYNYNSDGIRTIKTIGGTATTYLLDGSTILAQNTGNTTIPFYYDASGKRTAFKYNGEMYYYVYNLQGDVTHIMKADKSIAGTYQYDPYGRIINLSSLTAVAKANPFRYRGYYYDTESNLYYLNSRYYNPEWGRFINADGQLIIGDNITDLNLFVYCGNNSINRFDPIGEEWYHWVIGAAVVVGCGVATVATCGGFAAAVSAVFMVGSGMAAATTASTIAAGAFIGSSAIYGVTAISAASTSRSVKEFNNKGSWGTVAATAGGAVFGGAGAYVSTKTPTTKVYRSVSKAEAQDIKATGQFNLAPGGMESKQFGFNLAETRRFGSMMGQNTIVSAKVPTNMLNQFYTGGVDTSIFRSGTLTVYGNQLSTFNQAVSRTIKFMP